MLIFIHYDSNEKDLEFVLDFVDLEVGVVMINNEYDLDFVD